MIFAIQKFEMSRRRVLSLVAKGVTWSAEWLAKRADALAPEPRLREKGGNVNFTSI